MYFSDTRNELGQIYIHKDTRFQILRNAKARILSLFSSLYNKSIMFEGEADPCQWTNWSSCDFFCNTPRVPQRSRKKAEEDPKGQCREKLNVSVPIAAEEEDCDLNHKCTGKHTNFHGKT